jgi:thymidylate synthase ThyX
MYEAKMILDSVGPNGARLTTMELTYPRFIHAELMTHRMFSRNSASSRAIPTKVLLKRIEEDPALPVFWGKNQSGMSAREELENDALSTAQENWRQMCDDMIYGAQVLNDIGLHKQIANRVVEPWMFITVIVTATEWSNAWALRIDPAAQPEFCHVMTLAKKAYDLSTPRRCISGEWHMPYVTGYDELDLREQYTSIQLNRISIGRCAAVSYLNQQRQSDPDGDLVRSMKLEDCGHMSPFEHVAQAMTVERWESYAKELAKDWITNRIPVGNLWGWGQYRKTLADEHDFRLIKDSRISGDKA